MVPVRSVSRNTIVRLPIALMSFMILSCDNPVVPRAEYDALLSEKQRLEAINDSLQFENSDLKLYNDYLEAKLDSLQNN